MLHRSFKAAKCKTALKLAVSRIKLLKNKREAQVRQLKRELAQLLETGQTQTARIRVEHVCREQNTMAAYDLIEIYCELIAARLPMIESQKNCPIDLKEAISSVVFATPRCSDVPELTDVRKHITAKYGKEFVSAAVELRPDCGVNRMLVEKLSAKAPDGPTKIKILSAIAEEHNVKWDSNSFGDNEVKFPEQSLIGRSTSEKASHGQPYQVQVPSNLDERGPPNVHFSSQQKGKHDSSENLNEQNAGLAAAPVDGRNSIPGKFNQEMRFSGMGFQDVKYQYSHSEYGTAPFGAQNWNMDFKDATAAAQAAAESAERASMAARAAAELSSRGKTTQPYPMGPQHFAGYGLRDEGTQGYSSNYNIHPAEDSVNNNFYRSDAVVHNEKSDGMTPENLVGVANKFSVDGHDNATKISPFASLKPNSPLFDDSPSGAAGPSKSSVNDNYRSNAGMDNAKIGDREQYNEVGESDKSYKDGHESAPKFGQSDSLKSSTPFFDESSSRDNSHLFEKYPQNNPSGPDNSSFMTEVGFREQVSTSEVDFVDDLNADRNPGSAEYIGDMRMKKHPSRDSRSNSSTSNDGISNFNSQRKGSNDAEDFFVVDEGRIQSSLKEANAYEDNPVLFDDSGSEDGSYKIDLDSKPKEEESSPYFSSPGRKSPVNPSGNTKFLSPRRNTDETLQSYSSQSHFSSEQHLTPLFSVSSTQCAVSSHQDDLPTVTFDDSDGSCSESEEDVHGSKVVQTESLRKSKLAETEDHVSTSNENTSPRDLDTGKDNEYLDGSTLENGNELKFGSLTGGFRNKGYRRPPYVRSSTGKVSSSSEDTTVKMEESSPTIRTSVNSGAPPGDSYVKEVSARVNSSTLSGVDSMFSDSDNDDQMGNTQHSISSSQDSCTQNSRQEIHKKSRPKALYFDSDSSDSEDNHAKQTSTSNLRSVGGFSRRTKGTSGKSSLNWKGSAHGSSINSDTEMGRKSSSRLSYNTENKPNSSSQTSSAYPLKSTNVRDSAKETSSEQSQDKKLMRDKNTSTEMQPSISVPKRVISDSPEAPKSSKYDGDTSSKEKASHVHPKLPDYDSLTAHFQSLRRQ